MVVRVLLGSMVLSVALAGLTAGCGYRLEGRGTLPRGVRSVRVLHADASRCDEPSLGSVLAGELVRELGRAGVDASSAGEAEATLGCIVVRLERGQVLTAPAARALAGQELVLAVELRLADPAGETLWRSGLLEARQTLPLPGGGAASAATGAMSRALGALARQAARDAVLRLTSGF